MSGTSDATELTVPIKTIARLFRDESFKDKNSRITHQTLELSKEYISLFIEEAILRANEERMLEGEAEEADGMSSRTDQQILTTPGLPSMDTQEMDPEEDYNTQDQFVGEPQTNTNDVLDSRHLAKIAGILVLDF